MTPLPERLRAHWRRGGWGEGGGRVAVACSGGMDSLVLLHLLRFPLRDLGLELSAAHFDHSMRPGSREDAAWLQGVCGAWGIPLEGGRAERAPQGEGEARALRYAFLEGLLAAGRVDLILTAHQADDQVETILFRLLRGSGLEGLRGIPERRGERILRPLLSFTRAEVEEYARTRSLRPREDPSNLTACFARNRVRRELLPLLEAVHPGAREGILRMGRRAEEVVRALDLLLAPRLAALELRHEPSSGVSWSRSRFLEADELLQGELFRRIAREGGARPSEAGTAAALSFMRRGASGGRILLAGGLAISRDFDRFGLGPAVPAGDASSSLRIPDAEPGEGELTLGGRRYLVRWGKTASIPEGWIAARFDPAELRFPLALRGWRAGDRIRGPGGERKVKKLLGERRVPREERPRLPLLVDAEGTVLWIAGVSPPPQGVASGRAWPLALGETDGR
jgi:tRNA(Ile)-lysidine synthase